MLGNIHTVMDCLMSDGKHSSWQVRNEHIPGCDIPEQTTECVARFCWSYARIKYCNMHERCACGGAKGSPESSRVMLARAFSMVGSS